MVLTNKNKHWAWEWGLGYNRKWILPTEGHKGQSFQYTVLSKGHLSKINFVGHCKSQLISKGLFGILEFFHNH